MKKILTCPGKILLVGGYAVLYPKGRGLTVTPACHAYAMGERTKATMTSASKSFRVRSPQINGNFNYVYDGNAVTPADSLSEENRFVLSALRVAVTYLKGSDSNFLQKLPDSNEIHLFLDNSYYSLEPSDSPFKDFSIGKIAKTGLGSSAVVNVMIISSLLRDFAAKTFDANIPSLQHRQLIHLLSQISNALAQNKIGSGFDISSAVFGTQLFTRFPAEDLEKPLAHLEKKDSFAFAEETSRLLALPQWQAPKSVLWPDKLCKLVLLDFSMGSNTRILVPKVTSYLSKDKQYATKFVEESSETAVRFTDLLGELSKNESRDNLQRLMTLGDRYLDLMHDLGQRADVEVQPKLILRLINHFKQKFDKFIFGISPGAGGYDATALLVKSTATREEIARCLREFTEREGISMSFQEFDIPNENYLQEREISSYPKEKRDYFLTQICNKSCEYR